MKFIVITGATTGVGSACATEPVFPIMSGDLEFSTLATIAVGFIDFPDKRKAIGFALTPVFQRGEIVICNDDGREVDGQLRKPSKWDIAFEEFDTLDEAIERAKRVEAESLEELAKS